jgi:hypothetical protein
MSQADGKKPRRHFYVGCELMYKADATIAELPTL